MDAVILVVLFTLLLLLAIGELVLQILLQRKMLKTEERVFSSLESLKVSVDSFNEQLEEVRSELRTVHTEQTQVIKTDVSRLFDENSKVLDDRASKTDASVSAAAERIRSDLATVTRYFEEKMTGIENTVEDDFDKLSDEFTKIIKAIADKKALEEANKKISIIEERDKRLKFSQKVLMETFQQVVINLESIVNSDSALYLKQEINKNKEKLKEALKDVSGEENE